MNVTSKDIVGPAYTHIKRMRIDCPTVTHHSLLPRRPHCDSDKCCATLLNALKDRLLLFRLKIAILHADDIDMPAITQLLRSIRQDFWLTAK